MQMKTDTEECLIEIQNKANEILKININDR